LAELEYSLQNRRQEVKVLMPVQQEAAWADKVGLGKGLELPADLQAQLGGSMATEQRANGHRPITGWEALVRPDQTWHVGRARQWRSIDNSEVKRKREAEPVRFPGGLGE
jgi:hypothetical protein